MGFNSAFKGLMVSLTPQQFNPWGKDRRYSLNRARGEKKKEKITFEAGWGPRDGLEVLKKRGKYFVFARMSPVSSRT